MNGKDHFISWLREKVLDNPQEPPVESWQEISDALDLEETWEEIGEELEVNSVWDKVESSLNRIDQVRRFEKIGNGISIAALLLMFFSAFPGFQSFEVKEPVPENLITSQTNAPEKGPSLNTASEVSGKEMEGGQFKEGSFKSAKPLSKENGSDPRQAVSEASSVRESSSSTPVVEKSSSKKTSLNKGNKEEAEPAKESSELSIQRKEQGLPHISGMGFTYEKVFVNLKVSGPRKVLYPVDSLFSFSEAFEMYPGITAGVGAAPKISWLVNNKTLEAMERSSLVTAKPAYQTDYYLLFGARISNRLLLQTDFYLKDVVGQEYEEYRSGKYGTVQDRLYYQSLGLSLSRISRHSGNGKNPSFSRLLAGIYGGRLEKAEEIVEGVSTSMTEEYARFHMGAQLGYEHDTFLGNHFMLSYGLRSRFDLFNVYSGTENIPSTFRKTRGTSLDFTISLKYVLKK